MVARADLRHPGPSATSVVSVADLLARDAPWAGAPSAVPVATRVTAARTTAGASRAASKRRGPRENRLRRIVAAAWGPQWRFVTIAGAVLAAGLMANGVMLVTFSGPGHSATAEAEDGGYPSEDSTRDTSRYEAGERYSWPADSALAPMFAVPASASTVSGLGLGLPLTLASLGQPIPASNGSTATVLRDTPAASTPVRAVAPTTGGTGSVTTGDKSSAPVGTLVREPVRGLGTTVDDTASGLGKTVKKTTSGLGDTVGGVADGLTGSGSSSKSKSNSSNGSKAGSEGGGLLGGLLGE